MVELVELDNLDIKILAHLLESSRKKSVQEIAKSCLTSMPTVKSRVDRLVELGVIKKIHYRVPSSCRLLVL